jgi:hypothetical protein
MAAKRTTQVTAKAPPTSTLAIISLIAGVTGFTIFPFAGSLIAVVAGLFARREIQAAEGAIQGDGIAMAGLVLGLIGVGLSMLGLCLVGSVFGISVCLGLFAATIEQSSAVLPLLVVLV